MEENKIKLKKMIEHLRKPKKSKINQRKSSENRRN